ncbi:guanidinopropionase [Palleronia aestuarii]|uniref:Guanidinopropionase n=1 Tax=Palleronia aestuarii TaxID=568105 RepID=A0A2W7NRT9_9RHOB|nr:agmatinase [Palleronia aestuarii]PZX15996.1 guanidinopropionase [Palleronia aestuarii]
MRSDPFFHPVSGAVLPRFAGVPSFMRLPHLAPDHPRRAEVEVALFGMPWDGGTSNRPGARHGPRALRDASTMVRAEHGVTGFRPFEAMACADLGDVAVNPVDQDETLDAITAFVGDIVRGRARPLGVAGDHLCTLPVLRGLKSAEPPGLVLLDSHTDLYPLYFGGSTLTHGNPFRVAVEERLIDPARSIMIGMRGTRYNDEDRLFARDAGIRVVPMDELEERGIADVAEEARDIAGGGPAYLSFDIDFIDPAFAPGTGTPEVGGPTSAEALRLLRALSGLELVGADLVEVSPPFDNGGITAWLGASVLFELLCLMGDETPR